MSRKMTQHEILTLIEDRELLSPLGLHEYTGNNYDTGRLSLKKMHINGLIRMSIIIKKELFYELNEKGFSRLNYFNEHGCNNSSCPCNE